MTRNVLQVVVETTDRCSTVIVGGYLSILLVFRGVCNSLHGDPLP